MKTSTEKLRWSRLCEWAGLDMGSVADVVTIRDIHEWHTIYAEAEENRR